MSYVRQDRGLAPVRSERRTWQLHILREMFNDLSSGDPLKFECAVEFLNERRRYLLEPGAITRSLSGRRKVCLLVRLFDAIRYSERSLKSMQLHSLSRLLDALQWKKLRGRSRGRLIRRLAEMKQLVDKASIRAMKAEETARVKGDWQKMAEYGHFEVLKRQLFRVMSDPLFDALRLEAAFLIGDHQSEMIETVADLELLLSNVAALPPAQRCTREREVLAALIAYSYRDLDPIGNLPCRDEVLALCERLCLEERKRPDRNLLETIQTFLAHTQSLPS